MNGEVIKIEASAGTGKTYRLARRYIDLLMRYFPDGLGSILAITFTNKAAGEMKRRILSWLKETALGGRVEWVEGEISPEEEREIRQRALEAVEYILRNYTEFRVGTIDSFVRKIALAGAYEIGLPPRFDIAQHPEPYFERALDEMLDTHEELFRKFAVNYARHEMGTSWFLKRVILNEIKLMHEYRNTYTIPLTVREGNFEEAVREIKDIFQEFWETIDESQLKGNLGKGLSKFSKSRSVKQMKQALKGAAFAKKSAEDLFKKGAQVSEETKRLWINFREKLEDFVVLLLNLKQRNIFHLIEPVSETLENIKKENNLIFLEELNRIVYDKVKEENLEFPQIYINLSARIFHFLFDEFQDTNRMEWENLKPMIEDVFACGKGSLFVVGDIKQSIYRFRGASPELFAQLHEEIPKWVPLKEERLKYNWRSREVVLEFVKKAFDPENLENYLTDGITRDDLKIYEQVRETHEIPPGLREKRRGGYVEVRKVKVESESGNERVGEELKEVMRDVLERYHPGDVVVLVRKRDQAATVARWLSEEGVPVVSQSSLNLKEDPTVEAVVSLMRFLDSPIDDLSFANFVLSRLFQTVSGDRFPEVLKLLEGEQNSPLYKEFQRNFPELWERYFNHLFTRAVGFLPPYDLAVKIMETFSLKADLFLNQLLEVLWKREALGENSLRRFLEFWDSAEDELALSMPEGVEAVRIMTIHKAKGLEAPVVVVPFAELNPKKRSYEYLMKEEGLILNLGKYIAKNFRSLHKVYAEDLKNRWQDELNALYVAFTRARDELYIINLGLRDNKLQDYNFGYGEEEWEVHILRLGKKGKGVVAPEKAPSGDEFTPSFSWEARLREKPRTFQGSYLARKRGERVHRVLEFLGKEPPSPSELEELSRGFSAQEKEALTWLVEENPDLFSGEVFAEFEVVDGEGNTYRMDRVVLSDEVRVFEFKTGGEYADQHLQQLNNYLSLLSRVYPKKPLRGVLLYLDSRTRREVKWEN